MRVTYSLFLTRVSVRGNDREESLNAELIPAPSHFISKPNRPGDNRQKLRRGVNVHPAWLHLEEFVRRLRAIQFQGYQVMHAVLQIRRRLALGMLFGLLARSARPALANTYNVTPSSNLQTVINGTSVGDKVSFAAGTYNISAGLTLHCGVTYAGPVASPATAILNGASLSIPTEIFNLYTGSGPANPCSTQTLIEYLNFKSANGIFVQTPFTNLVVQFNQFTYIPGKAVTCPGGTGLCGYGTGGIFSNAVSGGNNANAVLSNTQISHNQIGDINSCISPTNVMADTDSPEDYEGVCMGMDFFTSINGLTVSYNNFNHLAEGTHIDCPNFGGRFVCEPTAGAITQDILVEYNDFNNIHRIPWEEQVQQSTGIQFINNSIHDFFNPYFGSFGLSMACCYNGTLAQPNMTVTGNLVLMNSPTQTGDYIGYGMEAMGLLGTYDHNLLQMNSVDTGRSNAPGLAYGCGPVSDMSYNVVEGNWGAYIVNEGISVCGTDTTPATMTENVTGATVSARISAGATISPAAGAHTFPLTVTLTDPGYTSGPQPLGNTGIWYTTDGSKPVPGQGSAQRVDSGASITLAAPATVKAVGMWGADNQPFSYAAGYGFVPSSVVNAIYVSKSGPPAEKLASVSVLAAQHSLSPGSTMQLIAACTYSDGVTFNCTAGDRYGDSVSSWNSSDSAVSVSQNGLATGVSVGSANITAQISGMTTPAWAVTTTPSGVSTSLSSVYLTTRGDATTVVSGHTLQIIAHAVYSDGSEHLLPDPQGNKIMAWNTSDHTIAKVSTLGHVTAIGAGTATVMATVGTLVATPVSIKVALPPAASSSAEFPKNTLTKAWVDQAGAEVGTFSNSPAGGPIPKEAGAPLSDSFAGPLWSLSAPAGGSASISDGHLFVGVPGGGNHDALLGRNDAVRVMQPMGDESFDVSMRIDSPLSAKDANTSQGLMVVGDDRNYITYALETDGTSIGMSLHTVTNGEAGTLLRDSDLAQYQNPMYMRLTRSGSAYVAFYSVDGLNWSQVANFEHTMKPVAIGPFAANHNDKPANTVPVVMSVGAFEAK